MRPEGRTDSRTDLTKLTVAFRNFANAPNKIKHRIYARIYSYEKGLRSSINPYRTNVENRVSS